MEGFFKYKIDEKRKQTVVTNGTLVGIASKEKGQVYVKDIGILVGIMKVMLIKTETINKIVGILKEEYRDRKGYSKNI